MLQLKNEFILFEVDDLGNVTHFENLKTGKGNVIDAPASLFRAVLQNGENWEDVAFAQNAEMTMEVKGNVGCIHVAALNTRMGRQNIALELTATLDGEKLRFGAEITNASDTTLVDFYYPCIGSVKTLGEGRPGLLYPERYGEYHTDICAEINANESWDGQLEMTAPYPYTLSMQWMTMIDGKQCLYMAGHDNLFHASSLRIIGHQGGVVMEMGKEAFAAPGEKWICPEYIVWLYKGVWQKGADEYSAWARTWRHPVEPKLWMKDMNGYYLVINKQQFGDELWPYETIPQLYDMAQANGCDTVGLFGWFQSGHDNKYPDLVESDTMGGEELLKKGIKNIQERGGHVTMYYQGHLMDLGTKFYREKGYRLEGKSRWGTPYYEQYSKYSESDFLRFYTRKMFSTVCPWCDEWSELMAQKADWVRSFGPDGVLYDQIGGIAPTPCFDTTHGHTKPSLSYSQGRLKLLSAIRNSVDKYPEFSFMTETITDVYSQFIDCIHGIGSRTGNKAERANALKSASPMVLNAAEMFRYCFPDNISTLRNPRPYLDPRMADYALCYGFRFEIELRYLKDKLYVQNNEHPEWSEHAVKVCALRKKYAELLLHGVYTCDGELTDLNPEMSHGIFNNGEKQCVVLWNDTDEAQPIRLGKYTASRWATADAEGEGLPETVAANSAIVLFK